MLHATVKYNKTYETTEGITFFSFFVGNTENNTEIGLVLVCKLGVHFGIYL